LFDDITISTSTKSYVLPYYSEELDDLTNCRFDLLNVNDTELDIVCTYNPEDFDSPVLGVRNKVRSITSKYFSSLFNSTPTLSCPDDIGCFKRPTISDLKAVTTKPQGMDSTDSNVYVINNASDINTIYAFSNKAMTIGDEKVTKIYKQKSSLYLSLSGKPTGQAPYNVGVSLGNYAPFSFSSTSNLDNYGNVLSTYLEYPYWISDLQDLVVGDNFKPQIKRIFYQPDRVNKNFYAIVDMYTGYDNPVENKILETDTNLQNNNMYLFKFSSLNNEFALTVNETLPIRVFGPDDVRRFSQCNQTQNMFFLSNICN